LLGANVIVAHGGPDGHQYRPITTAAAKRYPAALTKYRAAA